MKYLGLILLIVGTMIAAAFGAQNIDEVTARSEARVRAGALGAIADRAHADYCELEAPSPAAVALQEADGCPPGLAGVPYETLLERRLGRIEALAEAPEPEAPALAELRAAWIAAARDAAPALARLDSVHAAVTPPDELAAARQAAEAAEGSVDAALAAYCDAAADDDALAERRAADGCPLKRRSERVVRLQALAEETLGEARAAELPAKRRPLEAALREAMGEAALEAALAEERAEARAKTHAAMTEDGRAHLAERRSESAPEALVSARDAWLDALEATIAPSAAAVTLPDPPSPSSRLEGWLAGPGRFFFVGIVLIILGVVLARIANKRAAQRDADEGGGADEGAGGAAKGRRRVADFGALLGELADEVAALDATIRADDDPDGVSYDRIKATLEALALEKVDPLSEARERLIVRYGMNGFADVMSPFSAGERYLNRAWSTLVDRHWEEMATSVGRAAGHFAETKQVLEGLIADKAAAGTS